MYLAQLLADHGAREHLSLADLIGSLLKDDRWLEDIIGSHPVELVLHRFPLVNHFAQPATQIFDLKVGPSNRALIFLGVILIGIDALVVLEVHIVTLVLPQSFSCHSYQFGI